MYLLANDEKSQLGTSPLPDGMVRVFRDNGRDGLSYVTQQQVKYIPIGDKIELNLGVDPEVIFELVKLRVFRDNLWLQINGQTELRKIDGAVIKQENASLVGWDDHEIYSQRIRNYAGKEIEVPPRVPRSCCFQEPAGADALRLPDAAVSGANTDRQAGRFTV
jgi:hypothetical protein